MAEMKAKGRVLVVEILIFGVLGGILKTLVN
jgi:hypothetical protein